MLENTITSPKNHILQSLLFAIKSNQIQKRSYLSLDKLSSIILAAWLRVPRWLKQWLLVSITIFFFYMWFVKGLTSWHTLPPVTLLGCIIGSFFIWLIWLKSQKNM